MQKIILTPEIIQQIQQMCIMDDNFIPYFLMGKIK